jgi:hypothetical protein
MDLHFPFFGFLKNILTSEYINIMKHSVKNNSLQNGNFGQRRQDRKIQYMNLQT